jgi:hypothetical protein
VDLAIDLPPGFIVYRSGTTLLEEGTGMQGVQGWIREPDTGAPIRNVEVVLRQAPGPLVVTGETGTRGFFRLRTPLPGSYTLHVRALGYGEIQPQDLTVEEGKLTVLEIEMAPAPLEMEPIVAVGEPRVFQLEVQGFYDRADRGFGYFITPDDLESFFPQNYNQLFRHTPGIRVIRGGGGPERLLVYHPNVMDGVMCPPIFYLDGAITQSSSPGEGVAIGEVVSIEDIEAVEWYPRPSTAPPVWQAAGSRCGILVVWTKMG